MLNVMLKHLIYEQCIKMLFDRVETNFANPEKDYLSYEITHFDIRDCEDDLMGKCREANYDVLMENGEHRSYTTIFGQATVDDLMEQYPGMSEAEVLESVTTASIEYDILDEEDDWFPE